MYVYSAGHLKSGWFGSIDRNGNVKGFDAQGKPATYNGANTAKYAMASIAYAIAKRDERAISNVRERDHDLRHLRSAEGPVEQRSSCEQGASRCQALRRARCAC